MAHTKVENQLKRLDIRFWHVYPSSPTSSVAPVNVVGAGPPPVFGPLHSTLSHAIPALLIQSSDVLRDSAARDAAMPNIRVVPLAWWTAGAKAKGPKVVTCVKLRHVQQLVGRRIATASSQGVLRPSRRIVYDAHEALVCFLSDEVEGCMDEFKEEWESVSKIVVIAREGTSASPSGVCASYNGPTRHLRSCKHGKREAVGGCTAALIRLANR